MIKHNFYIVYPEVRFVSDRQIESWYADAVANDEIASEYLYAHDLQTKARGLSDSGVITLGVPPSSEG